MKHTLTITTPSDLEVVMTREFDAPRNLVWEAITRPEFIRRWLFLPPGWTMTRCEEDVRVGGRYRWAWNGPDGKEAMALGGVYREVVRLERLVRSEKFEFGGQPQAGEQLCTLTFSERAGTTVITTTVLYPNKESRDGMIASGMERGVAAGYDNMERLLAESAVA
jgi:uncharacterized protein YndB with AHSA1/START domain